MPRKKTLETNPIRAVLNAAEPACKLAIEVGIPPEAAALLAASFNPPPTTRDIANISSENLADLLASDFPTLKPDEIIARAKKYLATSEPQFHIGLLTRHALSQPPLGYVQYLVVAAILSAEPEIQPKSFPNIFMHSMHMPNVFRLIESIATDPITDYAPFYTAARTLLTNECLTIAHDVDPDPNYPRAKFYRLTPAGRLAFTRTILHHRQLATMESTLSSLASSSPQITEAGLHDAIMEPIAAYLRYHLQQAITKAQRKP